MVEGTFPKSDGDVLYASEINGLDSYNISSGFSQEEGSASDSNSTKTITSASVWILKNTGSNNIYINFDRSFGTGFFRKFIGEFKDNYKIMSVQSTAMFNNQQVPQVALKDTSVFQNPDIERLLRLFRS